MRARRRPIRPHVVRLMSLSDPDGPMCPSQLSATLGQRRSLSEERALVITPCSYFKMPTVNPYGLAIVDEAMLDDK